MERESREEPIDLHEACRLGDLPAIRQAYSSDPASLNSHDPSVRSNQLGWTPLYRAVIRGHRKAAQFLLDVGADPNEANNVEYRQMAETPLHQAADYSQAQMAALLLSHGADPNQQQGDGDTPLHHAAFRGDARMVGLLLGAKADPNVRNFLFGRTPLHYAVDCGHADCVRLLLAAGADVRLVDKVKASFSTANRYGTWSRPKP